MRKYIFFLTLLVPSLAAAQCPSPPAFPGCSPGGSIALTDGASVSSGQTHTFSGTATYAGIILNGGTLIVCGNLTLNSLVVNSGTIYVQSGAQLVVYNSGALVFGSNTNIYNYGTIDFKASIVSGANNMLMNCTPTAQFLVAFDQLIVQGPNTYFVNYGVTQCSYFIVQSTNSPGPVCLGNGSIIRTSTIINQYANAFQVPSGAACLQVNTYVINSSPVTGTSSLRVCLPTATTVLSGPNWGSATVTNNCNNCSVILLPVELLSFTGHAEGRVNQLEWSTASETNNCIFRLERSDNLQDFLLIATLPGAGYSNMLLQYAYSDSNMVPQRTYYYRLSQQDCDGHEEYFPPVSITTPGGVNDELIIWPNPADEEISLNIDPNTISQVQVYDMPGRRLADLPVGNRLRVGQLESGVYFITVMRRSGATVTGKLVKR